MKFKVLHFQNYVHDILLWQGTTFFEHQYWFQYMDI